MKNDEETKFAEKKFLLKEIYFLQIGKTEKVLVVAGRLIVKDAGKFCKITFEEVDLKMLGNKVNFSS